MQAPTRAEQVAQLQQFQDADLAALRTQLKELDARIASAESTVLHATNLASAARGVVGIRGGRPPCDKTAVRTRTKQRLWARANGTLGSHCAPDTPMPDVPVNPIGVVYTEFRKRFEAPRQSFTGRTGRGTVFLVGSHGQAALGKVRPGKRLWLIYWLDRNGADWRLFVRPPRAKGGWRVGVFATRSPNRPSPLGLTLCVVEAVDFDEGRIDVSGVDVLDETPLVGLKVYDPDREAWPGVSAGWVDQMDKLRPLYYDDKAKYHDVQDVDVMFDEEAEDRLVFINERSAIDVREMVQETLKRKRLAAVGASGSSEVETSCVSDSLPIGAFRVVYDAYPFGNKLVVRTVLSGMRREICEEESAIDPEALLHLDFQGTFSDQKS